MSSDLGITEEDRKRMAQLAGKADPDPLIVDVDVCPECDTTHIHSRMTKTPRYRCRNGHTFEEAKTRPCGATEA